MFYLLTFYIIFKIGKSWQHNFKLFLQNSNIAILKNIVLQGINFCPKIRVSFDSCLPNHNQNLLQFFCCKQSLPLLLIVSWCEPNQVFHVNRHLLFLEFCEQTLLFWEILFINIYSFQRLKAALSVSKCPLAHWSSIWKYIKFANFALSSSESQNLKKECWIHWYVQNRAIKLFGFKQHWHWHC